MPAPLPDTLLPAPDAAPSATISRDPSGLLPGATLDASTLPSPGREQFHRNLRAVELVLGGATQTSVAVKEGIPRSTLGRLVRRTRERGVGTGGLRGGTGGCAVKSGPVKSGFIFPILAPGDR